MGELKRRGTIWWIRWYRGSRRYEESSGSEMKQVARDLLKEREGAKLPITPQMNRLTFDEAAADLLNEYKANDRRSLEVVQRRIELHLEPYFGGWRLTQIATPDVRDYIVQRQAETEIVRRAYDLKLKDGTVRRVPEQRRTITRVSNAEINRELTILKRIFSLAIQSGKPLHKPHIPLLSENNTRTGFFEFDQFRSVLAHLPVALRPVIEFAYITGWRIDSEILPLEWRQVDFQAGEVRLDPGTTKNRDGRVFPMTDDLRTLLQDQHAEHVRLKKVGFIFPYVFFREVAEERGGEKKPRPIVRFNKVWKKACISAGCPGRIPHDLRRTAVRNMSLRGITEQVAMQLTGHRTRSIFNRYRIVSAGDLRTAASSLGGLMHNFGKRSDREQQA